MAREAAKNIKYGFDFGKDANELNVELVCYRQRLKTGYAREFHLRNAFKIVWPKFLWNEWCELMLWAWCNYRIVCIIGHTRASKTYFMAHLALLDYLCAPAWKEPNGESKGTATTLTTTKFDALKSRMWGDVMRAIESIENVAIIDNIRTNFKITNTTNEIKLALAKGVSSGPGDDKFMIQGVATDSADTTAGKIRGQHAERRRILGDEAQDISDAIYMAFANASSAPDFIGGLLSNPVEKVSEFGNWCKPKGGWESIHDTDLFWETETPGGICLHFDGLQSPNIKAGKTIFPFLLTQDYVDFIRTKYGEDSLEWWMYIRGFFPPDGIVARVWPAGVIALAEKEHDFDFATEAWASLDPAYDHDDCVLTIAKFGRKRDDVPCVQATKQHRIKVKVGPKEELKDIQIGKEVKRLCEEAGVQPDCFICDTTGNGRSVYTWLWANWGKGIHRLEYGGAATKRPLSLEDPKPSEEQVKYFVAELWFRAAACARAGMLCGLKNCDKKTSEDLNTRRYTLRQDGENKKMVVETKDEMKKRLGRSPDYGDSYCQFGELLARKGYLGNIPGLKSGAGSNWKAAKNLARKASRRFAQEYQNS